jgi:hypothetical protein
MKFCLLRNPRAVYFTHPIKAVNHAFGEVPGARDLAAGFIVDADLE